MTIDLDELERLEKAATKGPWHDASGKGSAVVSAPGENCAVYLNVRAVELDETVARWQADAALIVALRNEAVPMIQELRELREANKHLSSDYHSYKYQSREATTQIIELKGELSNVEAERDALRAEVERLKAQLATAREDALEEAARMLAIFSDTSARHHAESIRALKITKGTAK